MKSYSFNKDFCSHLEYHLCDTFRQSGDKEITAIWCDGISHIPIFDNQLELHAIQKTKKIITHAWMGKTGQDKYEMVIHFGEKALNQYAEGKDLTECLPPTDNMDWISINIQRHTIEIYLF